MTEEIKEILDKIDYVYDIQLDGTREHQYMRDIKDCMTNLQQENEKLKREWKPFKKLLSNAIDEVNCYKSRCEKANERLNNKIKEQNLLLIEFQDMEQKLKLKDNIINELEKYLEEQSTNLNRMSCTGHVYFMYQEDLNILNKLKELKESGNNE